MQGCQRSTSRRPRRSELLARLTTQGDLEADRVACPLGPLVGFCISRDLGKTRSEEANDPTRPLFGEEAPDEDGELNWMPVRIGAPCSVDLGKNRARFCQRAYLVNLPSRFLGAGAPTAWLCDSGSFNLWRLSGPRVQPTGEPLREDAPGCRVRGRIEG